MTRVSSYIIGARLPERDEVVMVHGYTGALDVVSTDLYDALQAGIKDQSALDEIPAELQQDLAKRGYLTDWDLQQEREHVWELSDTLHRMQSTQPILMIIPTYACNFRCPYCFELWMYDKGAEWMNHMMTTEQVDQIFDGIAAANGGSHRPGSKITLYGGEPLQADTVEIVNYIVKKGAALGYTFGAVTNGWQLELFDNLIQAGHFNDMQITVDGPASIHNTRRFKAGGEGTFDKIMENIEYALNHRVAVRIRVNVSRENYQSLPELMEVITVRGWHKRGRFGIYAEPVTGTDHGGKLTSLQLYRYIAEETKRNPNMEVLAVGTAVRGQVMGLLSTQGYFKFKGAYCGAHTGMMIFDAHNEIFSCWDWVGKPQGKVGSYGPEGIQLDAAAWGQWFNRTIKNVPECSACKYALICGGGCAVLAHDQNGTIYSSYCDGIQGLFVRTLADTYREWDSLQFAPLLEKANGSDCR